ncbi:GNAT family N-acetyltransferase [Zhongshania borealis]
MNTTNLQLHISGRSVTIRPIRISDQAIEAEFVRRLSPLSRHYRFFSGIRELSPRAAKSFCDVDGNHSMAFIATLQEEGQETQIGVSRFAPNNKEDVREMALTIADSWQKQGLGKLLCEKLFEFAKDHGVKKLYSVELADNQAMHDLARELGMTATTDKDDAKQVIYSLTL